jgi:hypothetical protein
MESISVLGRFLVLTGIVSSLIGAGLITIPKLASIGKTSARLFIRNDQMLIYSPLLMMVVISAILTLLINLVVRH